MAVQLGVSSNLILENRFVSAEELVEHVGAADIYITPYRQEAQIVSGTLAIALGAGKAIISTPYWHAKELLAEKRGVIVPFENPGAIAEAVLQLLENDAERHAMRKRAYLHSRENHMAEDSTSLYGKLSACALRAHVAAEGRPAGRLSRRRRLIDYCPR